MNFVFFCLGDADRPARPAGAKAKTPLKTDTAEVDS